MLNDDASDVGAEKAGLRVNDNARQGAARKSVAKM
jgi:hypothetical protein